MVLKGKISISFSYTHSIAVECLVMGQSPKIVPKIVHDTFLLGQPLLSFVGSGKITNRVPSNRMFKYFKVITINKYTFIII